MYDARFGKIWTKHTKRAYLDPRETPTTEQHTARLLSHLEKAVLTCMVTQGDPLYDVKFAEAVGTPVASPPESALATPAKRPAPAAHGTPAAKRARLSPKPEPADADDDPVASEPAMSGDDNE